MGSFPSPAISWELGAHLLPLEFTKHYSGRAAAGKVWKEVIGPDMGILGVSLYCHHFMWQDQAPVPRIGQEKQDDRGLHHLACLLKGPLLR